MNIYFSDVARVATDTFAQNIARASNQLNLYACADTMYRNNRQFSHICIVISRSCVYRVFYSDGKIKNSRHIHIRQNQVNQNAQKERKKKKRKRKSFTRLANILLSIKIQKIFTKQKSKSQDTETMLAHAFRFILSSSTYIP